MVNVKSAYIHSRYEIIFQKNVHVESKAKVFATLDSWTNMTDYMDPNNHYSPHYYINYYLH